MQCPVCQSEAGPQSTFCSHCGAPLSAPAPGAVPIDAPAPPPGYAPAPPAYPPPPASAAASGLSPNAASAIAYITFIPAILFLMIEPYNKIPLVRFHSFQSIGLAVVAFAVDVVLRIVLFPFGYIMYSLLQSGVSLAFFVVWIIVILKALRGEWYKLPIIGDFALKQAQS